MQVLLNESLLDKHDEKYDDPRLTQLLAVRYYIHHVIRRYQDKTMNDMLEGNPLGSNYAGLIESIRLRRGDCGEVCFVSFNYDTLLEQNFVNVGAPMTTSLEDHITNPHWKLIKPHGSIPWSRQVSVDIPNISALYNYGSGNIINEIIANASQLKMTDNYQYSDPSPMSVPITIPAIAVPFESKDEFECPQEHLDELVNMLPKVRGVLIIGWRATETKFIDLLRQHILPGIKWLCVNPNEDHAKTALENLKKAVAENDYSIVKTGFSDFVAHNLGDDFFRSTFQRS